jgi:hypothetical protein
MPPLESPVQAHARVRHLPTAHRCNPCMFYWPGALVRPTSATRRRAPPLPARASLPWRTQAWPATGSATNGSDQPGLQVNPAHNGQPGDFLLKRAPASLFSHAGPSTSIDPHRSVLKFRFKPLTLLDSHTRGPEHSFYDLNLLFLSVITF